MNHRFFSVAVVAVGLVACSDDGDDGANVLTGVFVDSPVAGLRFTTPTRSGLTNAAGEFKYLADETVAFSVGAVVLGSASGKAIVSPFDLFGLTPPSTERDLRTAIAQPGVDDFDRVLNVAMFLQSLDGDGDPGNGIDLGTWDERLAAATIDFEVEHSVFIEEVSTLSGLYPGVNRQVQATRVLGNLYRGLGIGFPVHMPAVIHEDEDGNGSVDSVQRRTYDAVGRETQRASDYQANGVDDDIEETTYDAQGRAVSYVNRYDGDDDGSLETRGVTTYTFDVSGNSVSNVFDRYTNEVLTRRVTNTQTFDAFGNTLTRVSTTDEDADGVIEVRSTRTSTYNDLGKVLTYRTETDSDADGVTDAIDSVVTTYGIDGFSVGEVSTRDSDADGVEDTRYTFTFTRDAKGRILTRTTQRDEGGVTLSRSLQTFTYNVAGQELTSVLQNDSNGDGVVNSVRSSTYTYNANGNLLTYVSESDSDGNGTVNSRRTTVWTYTNGKPQTETDTEDGNVDGTIDYRRTVQMTYDDSGNLIEEFASTDDDGDGTPDSARRSSYEYTTVDDVGAALESLGLKGGAILI